MGIFRMAIRRNQETMTSFNQLIHGGAEGQPSLDEALARLISTAKRPTSDSSANSTPIAFGGLFDLMRFPAGAPQDSEVCEDCKTLNRRGACYCKACMHKLPAYYASAGSHTPFVIWRRREREERRTSAWDLAAVWVVLTSLVVMTAYIPVG